MVQSNFFLSGFPHELLTACCHVAGVTVEPSSDQLEADDPDRGTGNDAQAVAADGAARGRGAFVHPGNSDGH